MNTDLIQMKKKKTKVEKWRFKVQREWPGLYRTAESTTQVLARGWRVTSKCQRCKLGKTRK